MVTARNDGGAGQLRCVEIERAFGSEALAVPGGRHRPSSTRSSGWSRQAVERFGRIDTYVANAIVTVMTPRSSGSMLDELRRVCDVNFFGDGATAYRAVAAASEGAPRAGRSCTSARRSRIAVFRCRRPMAARSKRGAVSSSRRGSRSKRGGRWASRWSRSRARSTRRSSTCEPQEARLPAGTGAADLPTRAVAAAVLHCAASIRCASCRSGGARNARGVRKLSPRGGRRVLGADRLEGQHTAEPSRARLGRTTSTIPCRGDPGAHGPFDDQARGSTLWTRLRLLLPKG